MKLRKLSLVLMGVMMAIALLPFSGLAFADDGDAADGVSITVSPMKETVILNPGDEYKSSFRVSNPGTSTQDVRYYVEVQPFYVDEDYGTIFENESNRGQMADWIKITSPEIAVLEPNETDLVEFTITVPKDSPAGGQYASVNVISETGENLEGIGINERILIGHLIFAEVTGDTVYDGEILEVNVPSFLLGGDIAAASSVKNTGNVHATATYTMKIYPIFSDKAVYDDSEEPEKHIVLPDRTFYNEMIWEDTPTMGIFNVEYTVEFQGLTTTVTRMVIVCPWWLLFIIIVAIMILVIRIVTLLKLQKVQEHNKAQM